MPRRRAISWKFIDIFIGMKRPVSKNLFVNCVISVACKFYAKTFQFNKEKRNKNE
jgi:hypothetical protein